MTTKELLTVLNENADKELLFAYAPGKTIPKAYHITEVKNIYFDSVDCGGNMHSERQTVVQLWVNPQEVKSKHMVTQKALEILNRVDQVKELTRDAEVFFEYGNKELPTSSYSVKKIDIEGNKITLSLYVQPTVCKPIEQLKSLPTLVEAACGPNSKCC